MSRVTRTWPVCSILLLWGCADAAPHQASGGCADAYGSEVCTWATVESGLVTAVGATVPLASIADAPSELPMTWPPQVTAVSQLPSEAQSSGVTHMTMYWEPVGHTPAPFLTPHFDFHFYLVPEEERLAIDCVSGTKPSALPTGYGLPDEVLPPDQVELTGVDVLVGVCVPQMGMHSLHMIEAEGTEPFQGTMIVGYWEGRPIFVEPMISQAYLMQRRSFDLDVPAIPGLSGAPTAFHAVYDADADAYRFEFSGFTQMQ
ncbi:MAG: hypothetical protein PVF19_11235 [Gemmatimonadota bacterium]|jgi:hypothetical protein